MKEAKRVQVGDAAPDFTLSDQTGRQVRLHELLGRGTVVLYFYPKDQTPGCTLEARAFRDNYDRFAATGAEVVGVSGDTVASHRRFAAREQLPFTLLSDRAGEVRALYGVEKTLGIVPGRVTYVIDREGIVRHIYSSQLRPKKHTRQALEVARGLTGSA